MTMTATVVPLFDTELHPGDFRGSCRKVRWIGEGRSRKVAGECRFATASPVELAAHLLAEHGIKDTCKVPAKIRPYPVPRAPKGEFDFTPKSWAAGDTVEFETKTAGTRTGQVWSDAPPPASVWVIDAETGEAWCVKKPGQYALAYAISMQWGGRA
jgi:hypothetical protein